MNFLSDVLDHIPVVGTVKGVVHHAVGDTEGGDKAFKSSAKTVGIVIGAAGGAAATGNPVGAIGGAYLGAEIAETLAKG